MPLIQPLPQGPLDVVGDVHGEWEALQALMANLGYNAQAEHPDGRTLVFLGDLVDRGPQSPTVALRVMQWVQAGRALCILGNHELNAINGKPKDGAGWLFEARREQDQRKYPAFELCPNSQKAELLSFLDSLPLVLHRSDLRVVHAAWNHTSLEQLSKAPHGEGVQQVYNHFEQQVRSHLQQTGLRTLSQQELQGIDLEHPVQPQRHLPAYAEQQAYKQTANPVRVLSSGPEVLASQPFYSSGKWRYTERQVWWNTYADATPVLVGHYWRAFRQSAALREHKGGPSTFGEAQPFDWLGPLHNVFCLDYSVGARFLERKRAAEQGLSWQPQASDLRLAAMRWPECQLVFDCGLTVQLPKPGVPAQG